MLKFLYIVNSFVIESVIDFIQFIIYLKAQSLLHWTLESTLHLFQPAQCGRGLPCLVVIGWVQPMGKTFRKSQEVLGEGKEAAQHINSPGILPRTLSVAALVYPKPPHPWDAEGKGMCTLKLSIFASPGILFCALLESLNPTYTSAEFQPQTPPSTLLSVPIVAWQAWTDVVTGTRVWVATLNHQRHWGHSF